MADISKINVNNTDYDIKDAVARGDISNLTDMEKSASGTIVSFNDGGDNIPVKSLVAEIVASQAGSGTPAPYNVRTISGWSECNLVGFQENLFNSSLEFGNIDNTGADSGTSARYIRSIGYTPVIPNTTYYFYGSTSQQFMQFYVIEYSASKAFIQRTGIMSGSTLYSERGVTYTVSANTKYIRVFIYKSEEFTSTSGVNISINYPSTDTSYHAYKGTTHNIPFGQTVYGGTLDVTKGVLTVDKGYIADISSVLTFTASTNGIFYSNVVTGMLVFNEQSKRNVNVLCSNYPPSSNTSLSADMNDKSFLINVGRMYIRNTDCADVTALNATIQNAQFVYPLATPITIQLTPTKVRTLLGENNIYANSGDISVRYFTQSAKNISDIAESSNKMDFSNPTGMGALSLNRKAGTTIGGYSAVTGLNNEASGNYTHSEGRDNVSSASFAHSEGRYATASSQYTHAEGYQTTASGAAAHAEGSGNTASGLGSHCEGFHNTASGDRAHAEGGYTIANHRSQHVFGEFNVADASTAVATARGNYAEIVGNGSNDANRSNARTLDWSGNETLAGKLSTIGTEIGGTTNGYHYVYDANNTIVAKTTADASGGNMYCYNSSGNESVAFTTGGTGYGQFRVRDASNTTVIQGVGSTGNITCVSLTQTSDANFKDVSDEAIPDVSAIKAVRFKWKEEHKFDESEHIGYLAQDVEKVLPFLVKEDAEGNKALDYIAFLVAKVDSLEKRISELEKGE